MTPEEELALVDAELAKLYASGVEEWSESSERVRKIRFESLTARKDVLENKIAQQSGQVFRPVGIVSD